VSGNGTFVSPKKENGASSSLASCRPHSLLQLAPDDFLQALNALVLLV